MPMFADDYDMDREALLGQMGTRRPREQGGITGGQVSVPGITPSAGTPPAAPSPSVFQSDNQSVSGYLQDAMNAYRPEIIKIGDEAGRKKAAEDYIRSLMPEIEKRGGKVGEIKGEKLQLDGKWFDLLKDIEGEAGVQFIEPGTGDAAGSYFGMSPLLAGGSSLPTNNSDFFLKLMEAARQSAGLSQQPNDDNAAIFSLLQGGM